MLRHRVLYSEKEIASRVLELADQLARDLPSARPLLIGLLTGSFVFLADLVRALARKQVEPRVDFMAVAHYGAATESTGAVQIHKGLAVNVAGEVVLLVDDILDSGFTLRAVKDFVQAQGPAWLRSCVLLDKPSRRAIDLQADYVGFQVPDVWIIGYGLDKGGEGRALPYIAAIEPETQE